MQKSYISRKTIDLSDFYVRAGDILVHDTGNANRLTVYRNGEIVKITTHTPGGLEAMLRMDDPWLIEYKEPEKDVSKKTEAAPKPMEITAPRLSRAERRALRQQKDEPDSEPVETPEEIEIPQD